MNVYGVPQWPYNRGDEMANQMFAQQALGGAVPSPHAMPVPSGQPWDVQSMPWGLPSPQPQVMQFTAQAASAPSQDAHKAILHCKRKPADIEPEIPAKQFISEEKMAAHMSSLHISPTYTSHQSEENMDIFNEPSTSVSDKLKGRTLILCDEFKKIQAEPLIPTALLERLEKPCMSLVVWKPKEEIVDKILDEKNKKSKNPSEATKRNGVLVTPEQNMDVEMR